MKKILNLFLSLSIILTFIPITPAHAESNIYTFNACDSEITGNFSTYEENGKTVVSFLDSVCFMEDEENLFPQTPTLKYTFTADNDGYYHIWINAKAKSSGGDSIWVKFDNDNEYTKSILPVNPDDFIWNKLHTSYLTKGTHSITLVPREKKLDILEIIITDDGLLLPGNEQYYELPDFFPPENTHPRVLFTKDDISLIKSKLNDDNITEFEELHNKALKLNYTIVPSSYNASFLSYIKSSAFDCVINSNNENGALAIEKMSEHLEALYSLTTDKFSYAQAGNVVYTASLVYDWCYDKFSSQNERKLFLEKILNIIVKFTETKWPPLLESGWTGHGSESSVLRDARALGIAAYDEYPYIYNTVTGRILDEYKEIRQLYYEAQKSPFGSSYGLYRGKHDINSMLLFKAIGVDNIWETDNIKYLPYWFLYATRSDGFYLSEGDTTIPHKKKASDKQHSAAYPYYILGSLYNDGYLLNAFNNESMKVSEEYLECIIFGNDTVDNKNVSSLSYSKYFGYPSGQYIARTGWDDNSAVVQMKINELDIMEHNHQDAGAFQIYYKGALATDSGYYQSEDGSYYGSPHHTASTRQTIAHNCMLIYDENESADNFKYSSANEGVNSGGQFFASKNNAVVFPDTVEELRNDVRFNTSKVLAHEHNEDVINPDYTYLKGDLAGAYSDKVTDYERSFMFLNLHDEKIPAVLIVFDHVVSSNADFEKTYLLHGVNAPEISGTRTILKRTETNYDGLTYNGKLVNDTLLPKSDNVTITQVGESADDFLVNGVNYPATVASGGINEGGGIRTEIKPSIANEEDYFLNVMQITDADNNEIMEAELIESQTHTGVKISDRVVLFGKTKEKNNGAEFSFDGNGACKITGTDMEEGIWDIYKDGKYYMTQTVTDDRTIVSFEGEEGTYEIIPEKNAGIYSSEVFYDNLNSYNGKNAFIAFSRIYDFPVGTEIVDFGFLLSDNKDKLVNNHTTAVKASAFEKLGNRFDDTGKMEFGTIFYGTGIKNFTMYYVRPYIIYKKGNKTKTVYGDIRQKFVRNYDEFDNHNISCFEIK